MQKLIISAVLLTISFAATALPPDIQADRYLIQVQKAITGKNKDFNKAVDLMDKIMALKDQQNLELPIEFYFKYAKIYSKSNKEDQASKAFTAINHYLETAGKSGKNYKEALDIYNWAFSYRLSYTLSAAKVKEFIAAGADVNAKFQNGETPLHGAVWHTNPDIIKALIASGADVNAKNKKGETPLHGAVWHTNPDIIKALITSGADVNAKNKKGKTPLHIAALRNKSLDIIKTLIAAGADVNAKSENGKTPLHIAAALNKNLDIIKTLIAGGADVNTKVKYDKTPLHYAAEVNQNQDIIKTLIAGGADVNAKDENGYTLLHGVVWFKHNPDIIKTLIAGGADVNAKSKNGITLLDVLQENKKLTSTQKAQIKRWLQNPSLVR